MNAEFKDYIAGLLEEDAPELFEAIVTVGLNSDELEWGVDVCLATYHRSQNEWARGNAVISLAHLARRFRRMVRLEEVAAVVLEASEDPSPHISGHAHSAADDFSVFLDDFAIFLPSK